MIPAELSGVSHLAHCNKWTNGLLPFFFLFLLRYTEYRLVLIWNVQLWLDGGEFVRTNQDWGLSYKGNLPVAGLSLFPPQCYDCPVLLWRDSFVCLRFVVGVRGLDKFGVPCTLDTLSKKVGATHVMVLVSHHCHWDWQHWWLSDCW